MDDIPIGTLVGVLFVLLILSGCFSLAETSMMALNRYRLKHLVLKGHRGAKLASQLLDRTDRLLGVILLGNNLLNAAIATLGAVIAIRFGGENELSLMIATGVITFLILVLSEITPKVIGATYADKIAPSVSFVLMPLLKLAYPIVWFVNLFVSALLWLLRLRPFSVTTASPLSTEELRTLVLEGSHFIPSKQQSILLNLFELEKITVEDVMTPRNQIEAINLDDSPAEIQSELSGCQHTRLPVYQEKMDNIIGILHARRAFKQIKNGELNIPALRSMLQEPYFIPSTTPLITQLQHFQESRRHIALVVDEYGELLGLISLEDILEEIVGDFAVHSPLQSSPYVQEKDGSWLVDGGVLLRNLNRKLGLKFPIDGPKTLNGIILEHLENIPEAGTSLKIGDQSLEIIQTQDRIVKVVRIVPQTAK